MKRTAGITARVGLSLAMLSLSVSGCGTQLEGEYCSQLNGSDDCDTGLVCTPLSGVGARCCPPPGRPSSVAACKERLQSGGAAGASGAPGADASETPPSDAGDEASVEAGVD